MPVLTSLDPRFRDPFFRELDRLTAQLLPRRVAAPTTPVDAYRHGEELVVRFDLPGIDPASVEVTVDKNVLSVTAERAWSPEEGDQVLVAERPQGRFARRLRLGDHLDTAGIDARYDRGVLSLHIPVSAAAKPRRIPVTTGGPATSAATGDATPETVAAEAPAPADAASTTEA